jgi:uncharacterized protein (TIGR00369 family)
MNFTAADPGYEQKVRQSFQRQRFMGHLGARLERVEPGFCEIRLFHKPELTQQHGFFHAGVISTVADTAAGYAAYSLMPAGVTVMSVEFKLNLLLPGDGPQLIGRGQVVKAGRTLTACRADVYKISDETETLCATALLTMMAVRRQESGYSPK